MEQEVKEKSERIWDYTTLDTFLTCRRKYYWMIVRDLRVKRVSPALLYGQVVHAALAEFYTKGLDAALKLIRATYQTPEGEELRTTENMIKLMEWYGKVYAHEPFKVLNVEVGFAVPLGEVMYAGRLDALVDWNGGLFVLEHKTTSRLDGNFFKQFKPNMQVDGYTYGASVYTGKKCLGTVINALETWKDVKRVTDKTKRPEDHFARDPNSRTEAEIADFVKQVPLIVHDALNCEQAGGSLGKDAFYQNKHMCRNFNFDCPYRDLCLYGENERIIEQSYTKEKWVPYKEGEE